MSLPGPMYVSFSVYLAISITTDRMQNFLKYMFSFSKLAFLNLHFTFYLKVHIVSSSKTNNIINTCKQFRRTHTYIASKNILKCNSHRLFLDRIQRYFMLILCWFTGASTGRGMRHTDIDVTSCRNVWQTSTSINSETTKNR